MLNNRLAAHIAAALAAVDHYYENVLADAEEIVDVDGPSDLLIEIPGDASGCGHERRPITVDFQFEVTLAGCADRTCSTPWKDLNDKARASLHDSLDEAIDKVIHSMQQRAADADDD